MNVTLPRCWGEHGAPLSAFVISSSIVWKQAYPTVAAANADILRNPRFGSCSFSVAAINIWNTLP